MPIMRLSIVLGHWREKMEPKVVKYFTASIWNPNGST